MSNFAARFGAFVLLCLASFLSGCNRTTPPQSTLAPSNRVVLYCSVDEVYAKPIIKDLEQRTGLRIDALFDTEATKTAGLTNRIRTEKSNPRGDVFWSSALLQTLLLQREGLLQPYVSISARDVPQAFKDKAGYWTGMGARARVFVWHQGFKGKASQLSDLLQPSLKNRVAISNPQFGTASDWAAALGVRWGAARTTKYFAGLKGNGVQVLPGNSDVARRVATGELLAGVTDADDFWAQNARSSSLQSALIQPASKITTTPADDVRVPGSVAMLAGAPHPQAARKLIDALLAAQIERALMQQMRGVVSVRDASLRSVSNDSARWSAAWDKLREPLAEILLTN